MCASPFGSPPDKEKAGVRQNHPQHECYSITYQFLPNGQAVAIQRGRIFVFDRVEPYTKQDGEKIELSVYFAACKDCSRIYRVKLRTKATHSGINARCPSCIDGGVS